MKKLILTAAVAVFGLVSAQKNTLLVGGNVAYNTTKTELTSNTDSKTDTFEFSPTIGYQFSDNMTVGVNTSFSSIKDATDFTFGSNVYNAEIKESINKFGAFVRYAQPLSNIFAVYGDLGAGYQTGKVENFDTLSNVTTTSKYNGMYVQFTPALFINFKNSFGLNFNIGGLGYSTMKNDATNLKTNSFNFSFGKEFGIGISKNFKL